MLILKCVLIFALLFGAVSARVSPAFIKKCAKLTPECLKKTIQEVIPQFVKGVPALGVDPADPLMVNISKIEPIPGLKVQLLNGRLTGLRNCIVDSAKFENKILDVKVHCNITTKGKYEAGGKILIVTLNGDGDAKIKASNVKIHAKLKFEEELRNGVTYRVIKDYNVRHKFEGRVTFLLTNLFRGNPELSKAVLKFLNENWKYVADEIGGPVVKVAVDVIVNILKKFFKAVPKDELFN